MPGRVDWLIFHRFFYLKKHSLPAIKVPSVKQRSAVTLTMLQRATAVIVFRGNAGIFVGGLLMMINVFNVL